MPHPHVTVDDAIESILGPLSDSEHAELEADILVNGVHTALVVWSTGDVLLDGHNRYRICQRHGLDFPVRRVDLPDRDAAMEFVENTQLARRNLTPERYAYIRGRKYNRLKGKQGGTGANQHKQTGKTFHSATAEQIAEQCGVTGRTVRADAEFAEAVDEIGKADPKAKAAILDRKAKVTRAAVKEAAKAGPAKRAEFARAVVKDAESGGKAPRRQAAPRSKPKVKPSKIAPVIHDMVNEPGRRYCIVGGGFRVVIRNCGTSRTHEEIEMPPSFSILTVEHD